MITGQKIETKVMTPYRLKPSVKELIQKAVELSGKNCNDAFEDMVKIYLAILKNNISNN